MNSTSAKPPPTKLNLGCGRRRLDDAINLDIVSDTQPDVIHDLNIRPWPFDADRFAEIHAYDVIEHLHDVVATMEEVHRVARPGGVVHITLPHFSSANAYTDPTHRHQFSWYSFHYFTGEHQFAFYSRCRFKRRRSQIIFYPTLLNKVVWRLANRRPEAYERRWAWIFPAWYLHFELEAVK